MSSLPVPVHDVSDLHLRARVEERHVQKAKLAADLIRSESIGPDRSANTGTAGSGWGLGSGGDGLPIPLIELIVSYAAPFVRYRTVYSISGFGSLKLLYASGGEYLIAALDPHSVVCRITTGGAGTAGAGDGSSCGGGGGGLYVGLPIPQLLQLITLYAAPFETIPSIVRIGTGRSWLNIGCVVDAECAIAYSILKCEFYRCSLVTGME